MGDPNCNPNCAPQYPHSPTLLGGAENMKVLFDEVLDNRREMLARSRAWESISLLMANNATLLSNRLNNDSASFSHAVSMGSLLSAQAGVTEAQQTVSPIKVGAADAQNQQPAGAVYPPIRNVDQMGAVATGAVQTAEAATAVAAAGVATANQALADALAAFVTGVQMAAANFAQAATAVLTTAAGGASTPSQTQAKPTA